MSTDQHNPASRLRAFAGATFHITIKGDCMAPALGNGQLAPVREALLYLPGDIIVFETDFGQMLAHRLLGYYLHQGKLRFLTQADNAPDVDRGISGEKIIGKIQRPVTFKKRLFSLRRFLQYTHKQLIIRELR